MVWLLLAVFRWLRHLGERPNAQLPTLADCTSALLILGTVGAAAGVMQPLARTPLRSIACGTGMGGLLWALLQLRRAWGEAPPTSAALWADYFTWLPLFATVGSLVWLMVLHVDPSREPEITIATAPTAADAPPRRLTRSGARRLRWCVLVIAVASAYGFSTAAAPYVAVVLVLTVLAVQVSPPPLSRQADLWVAPRQLLVEDWRGVTRVAMRDVVEAVALPLAGVPPTSVSKEVVTLAAMLRLQFMPPGRTLPREVYVVLPDVPGMTSMANAEAWAERLLRWREEASVDPSRG